MTAGVRAFLACVCLLSVTACDGSPSGPTVDLDQRFTLAVGETASVGPDRVRLEFLEVSGDSRCPADALCIQGGDAQVRLRAGGSAGATLNLHTGDESRAAAVFGDLRVELKGLQPYPFSSRTIEQRDYRATLTVTRQR